MLTPPLAEQGYYGESLERPEARGIYHDAAAEKALFGPEGLTFDSFLDVINPLHHIPVVNSVYTELTGDKIATGPSVIGGLLFGGAIGVVGSVANAAFEAITGDSVGGHAMTALRGDEVEAATVADGQVAVGEVKLAGAAASEPMATAAAPEPAAAAPPISALAAPPPRTGTGVGNAQGSPTLTAGNMFRARDPAMAPSNAAVPEPVAMPAALPDPQQSGAAAAVQASEMPQLSADLDARLRHAQKALAASGLVAAPDAAMQSRLGEALTQATAPGETPVPHQAQAQAQTQAQMPQAQAQPAQAQAAQVQEGSTLVPAPPGNRHYMPLDADGRDGRRWFGLGTAELSSGAAPASPQMAAQALASQVYRQQAAAAQAAAGGLDVSY